MYTKEDAMEKSQCECKICGAPQDLYSYDSRALLFKKMRDEHLCFTCAFWKEKIGHPLPGREIINGCHYVFHPFIEKPKSLMMRGSGGSVYYILKNDGTVLRSNDVWFQGNIPERFRDQLPDSAKMITKEAFYKIQNNECFSCPKKGCFDRYHCYFYHPEEHEADGPFNIVPNTWKVGREQCPSFLDKDKMYNND